MEGLLFRADDDGDKHDGEVVPYTLALSLLASRSAIRRATQLVIFLLRTGVTTAWKNSFPTLLCKRAIQPDAWQVRLVDVWNSSRWGLYGTTLVVVVVCLTGRHIEDMCATDVQQILGRVHARSLRMDLRVCTKRRHIKVHVLLFHGNDFVFKQPRL